MKITVKAKVTDDSKNKLGKIESEFQHKLDQAPVPGAGMETWAAMAEWVISHKSVTFLFFYDFQKFAGYSSRRQPSILIGDL